MALVILQLDLKQRQISEYVLVGLIALESIDICLTSIIKLLVSSVENSVDMPASEVSHILE